MGKHLAPGRSLARCLAVAVLALLLGACGGTPPVDDGYLAERDHRVPALLRSPVDGSAGAAGIDGVLMLLEGEACFMIAQELGTSLVVRSLVVWPLRAEPFERDGRLLGVRVPSFEGRGSMVVEVGDRVRAAGRYRVIEQVGLPPGLPHACLGDAPEVTFVDDLGRGGRRSCC